MKLVPIKRFHFEGNITYFDSEREVLIPEIYIEKDKEMRGVWFATVGNVDIPKLTTIDNYKEYLINVIQKIKDYKMNTIIFQVRPANDAFYESQINPWSKYITGTEGKYPGFDVFGWFIEEAKKNNIEVHAWLNPYRISTIELSKMADIKTKEEYLSTLSENNFARKNSELTIVGKDGRVYFHPGKSEVIDFITETMLEVCKNYDIKSLHMDDYFYPYGGGLYDEDELPIYEQTKEDGETLSDWRRHNVNRLIEKISNKLKEFNMKNNRNIEFGVSPFCVYRTNIKYAKNGISWGSNNASWTTQCYHDLYADVFKWMEEKWIDYVMPQLYFDLDSCIFKKNPDGTKSSELEEVIKYAEIAEWWSNICKKTNCKLYFGQGLYQYVRMPDWLKKMEIPYQLKFNTTIDNYRGSIFYTWHNLVDTEPKVLVDAREENKKLWTKDVSVE